LISLSTFEAIQERLTKAAHAPARPDLNEAFPLRGAVRCGDCDKPYRGAFSRSRTGKRHAYYVCQTKTCDSYGKSIKRAEMESSFENLLGSLKAGKALLTIIQTMFSDAWKMQSERAAELQKTIEKQLGAINTDIDKLVDRLLTTHSPSVSTALERKIEALEHDKLKAEQNLQLSLSKAPSERVTKKAILEPTLQFLSNPCFLWINGSLALKLAFPTGLVWQRNEGYRTAQTSSIYRLFEHLGEDSSLMVRIEGLEPPRLAALEPKSSASTNFAISAR
jgi:site-specific DNA recombinase